MPNRGIDGPLTFPEVLDRIETSGHEDKVRLGEILASFGRRAFGPVLLVPALIAILPVIGALPGVSLLMAGLELVVAVQLLLGQRGFHLPRAVRRLAVPRRALLFSVGLMRPAARVIGRVVHPRLKWLINGGTRPIIGVLALVLAILMLIGALVPGGIVLPAIAMMALGLGLTSHDGALVLVALGLGVGSIALGLWWLL